MSEQHVLRQKLKDPLSINIFISFIIWNKALVFIFINLKEPEKRFIWLENYMKNPFQNPFVTDNVDSADMLCSIAYIYFIPLLIGGAITFFWPKVSNFVEKYLKIMEQNRKNTSEEIERNLSYQNLDSNNINLRILCIALLNNIYKARQAIESSASSEHEKSGLYILKNFAEYSGKVGDQYQNDSNFKTALDHELNNNLSKFYKELIDDISASSKKKSGEASLKRNTSMK